MIRRNRELFDERQVFGVTLMRCLITGGTGFVGSHVVELAIKKGWDVICPVRDPGSLRHLKGMRVKTCGLDGLETELRRSPDIDYVIHIAGATRALTLSEYQKANVEFTGRLFHMLIKADISANLKRFVLVSSQAAAGPSTTDYDPVSEDDIPHPISNYGRSKLEGEKVALEFKAYTPITIVRPPTVFGPRDTDVFGVFKSARFRVTPVIAGPERMVSIIYVEDLADGIITAAIIPDVASGEIFFLANEKPVIWREFAQLVGHSMGYRPLVTPIPLVVLKLVGKIGDFTGKLTKKPALIRSEKIIEMEQLAWVCSTTKAKRILSWSSVTALDHAIDITRDWYEKEGWL